jgi:hypothetical protein
MGRGSIAGGTWRGIMDELRKVGANRLGREAAVGKSNGGRATRVRACACVCVWGGEGREKMKELSDKKRQSRK